MVGKGSLFKSFTIFSLITFIVTGTALATLIYNHMKDDKINFAIEAANLALKSIVEPELIAKGAGTGLSVENKDELDDKLNNIIINNTIFGIEIVNSNEKVIYSIGSKQVLKYYDENKSLDKAPSNQYEYNVINNVYAESETKILTLSIPIEINGKYFGKYVVFQSYDKIEQHLRKLLLQIFTIVFTGLILLYLLLIRVIFDSSNTLIKQNKELIENSISLQEAYNELNNTYKSTIITLSNAIDARDSYTAGHSKRVADLSVKIASEMGLNGQLLNNLEIAALFHDVGKIGIRDNILLKDGKLTDEEFNIIKEHSWLGAKLLENMGFIKNTLDIILYHHERYDGGGYPNGLIGEEIPLESRIIAVADTYDAMTSDRSYRKGVDHLIAVKEIVRQSRKQFDPKVVDAFLKIENTYQT